MLEKRKHLPSYPDGVVRFYVENDNYSTFAAKQNAVRLNDLTFVDCVVFSREAIRERDIDFAEQQGQSLTLKLRCPLCPRITAECKALIGDTLYDVTHIDPTNSEVYVYLGGGRIVDTGTD